MNIAFADGSQLNQDPRREDPLFYYVRAADWSDAIGFLVLPEYAEHAARSVTLQVYPPHASRVNEMSTVELDLMAMRVVASLSAHFRQWVDLEIDWQGFGIGRVGRDGFARAAVQAGWLPGSEDADAALQFTRRAPAA